MTRNVHSSRKAHINVWRNLGLRLKLYYYREIIKFLNKGLTFYFAPYSTAMCLVLIKYKLTQNLARFGRLRE